MTLSDNFVYYYVERLSCAFVHWWWSVDVEMYSPLLCFDAILPVTLRPMQCLTGRTQISAPSRLLTMSGSLSSTLTYALMVPSDPTINCT